MTPTPNTDASNYAWRGDSYYEKQHVRLRVIAASLRRMYSDAGRPGVLDIGCGAGLLGAALGEGFDYFGCDASDALFAEGETPDGHKAHWAYDEARPALPFDDRRFDIVVCSGFLEYVSDRAGFLKCVRARLAGDGLFVASFINFHRWDRRVGRGLRRLGIPLSKVYHPLWRNPQTFDQLIATLQSEGLPVRAAIALPGRSVASGTFRVQPIPGAALTGTDRAAATAFQNQAVFFCSASNRTLEDAFEVP